MPLKDDESSMELDTDSSSVLFRDFALQLAAVLLLVVIAFIPYLNPIAEEKVSETESPGLFSFAISWRDGNDDIDMWILGPGEPYSIGYSRPAGKYVDLLKDDRGYWPDMSILNHENAYARGGKAGEYILNLHCYRCAPPFPLEVAVYITRISSSNGTVTNEVVARIFTLLTHNRQERTIIRFKIDAEGKVDKDSFSTVFKSIVPVEMREMLGPQGG